MAVDLKDHPGLNPDYFRLKAKRESVQAYNRTPAGRVAPLRVPPQPDKYVPHIGAKQRAKGTGL